jgi:hypothetical protein
MACGGVGSVGNPVDSGSGSPPPDTVIEPPMFDDTPPDIDEDFNFNILVPEISIFGEPPYSYELYYSELSTVGESTITLVNGAFNPISCSQDIKVNASGLYAIVVSITTQSTQNNITITVFDTSRGAITQQITCTDSSSIRPQVSPFNVTLDYPGHANITVDWSIR